MVRSIRASRKGLMSIVGLAVFGGFLGGCTSGNQMSQKDIDDIKKGPPKEMPAEALKVMQQAGHNGPPQSK